MFVVPQRVQFALKAVEFAPMLVKATLGQFSCEKFSREARLHPLHVGHSLTEFFTSLIETPRDIYPKPIHRLAENLRVGFGDKAPGHKAPCGYRHHNGAGRRHDENRRLHIHQNA